MQASVKSWPFASRKEGHALAEGECGVRHHDLRRSLGLGRHEPCPPKELPSLLPEGQVQVHEVEPQTCVPGAEGDDVAARVDERPAVSRFQEGPVGPGVLRPAREIVLW